MTRARPFFRFAAALLCFQPIFFHSSTVLAQNLDPIYSLGGRFDGDAERQVPGDSTPRDLATGSTLRDLMPPAGQREGSTSGSSTPLDEPVNAQSYVCGPGDVFELGFWGLQNFRQRVTVDVEGRAFVPKIGFFDVNGKLLSEVRRAIRAAVAGYYPRLQFDLTLSEPRTFLVQVAGNVVRPASYPSRATERVATLIGRAGGYGPKASRRVIEIRHRDGMVEHADLFKFELTGDNRFNPHVLDGDAIQVGFEELAASVDGGVNRPGRYELVGSRDLAELVELAGGLSPDANNELAVRIVRWSEGGRQDELRLPFSEGGRLPDAEMQKEDQVRIPTTDDLQKSVYVIGAVKGANRAPSTHTEATGAVETTTPDEVSSTRRIPFVSGETVSSLLARVGGVGPLADLGRSYILRDGKNVPVDLEKLIVLRDLSADRGVALGDTLVVPFRRRNILVEGAVFAAGSYPYNPAFGIDQYIALAGGPSRNAQGISSVRVVTPAGEMKPYHRDLVVEPGSSLVVPERHYSRAEVVQIGISIASIIISGVAVFLAAKK